MGFLKNLFGKSQQETVLSDNAIDFFRDLAYIMGYRVNDTTKTFAPDVMSVGAAIIDILRLPTPNSVKQAMISDIIWERSKHPEFNADFINRILAMSGRV